MLIYQLSEHSDIMCDIHDFRYQVRFHPSRQLRQAWEAPRTPFAHAGSLVVVQNWNLPLLLRTLVRFPPARGAGMNDCVSRVCVLL